MTNESLNNILRELPAVHIMLDSPQGALLIGQYGRDMVFEACQIVLGNWRRKVIRESCRELPDL